MKRIYLKQVITEQGALRYEVIKLVGSVDFELGNVLGRAQVADLCGQTGIWRVTVTKG